MSKKILTILISLYWISGASAQLPVTEGLIVHLRADSLTGLEDGDPVAVWVDSAQDDPVDGTVGDVGSGVPEYKADVMFDKPVVRFNGSEALSSAQFAIPDLDAGVTCVMVCTGDKTGELHERLGHFGAWDAAGGVSIAMDVCTQQGTPQGSGFRLNNGWSLAGNPNPMTTGFHIGVWQATQGTLQSDLIFYVDGVRQTLTQNNPGNNVTFLKTGNVVAVGDGHSPGGSFYSGDFVTADLAVFIIYNRMLSAAEVATLTDYLHNAYLLNRQASNPNPASGSMVANNLITLSWTPGGAATSHKVYLGTNEADVASAEESALIATTNQSSILIGVAGQPVPEGLTPGSTYYWRVDEITEDGSVTEGSVWSFGVPPMTAYDPVPVDGASFVLADQTLTWEPGLGALAHTIYFGTDADAVAESTNGLMQVAMSFTPPALEAETTYYWRVDEFTLSGTIKGPVWSFTTIGEIPVEDDSLLGWWNMDQVDTSSILDMSGHGNHGSIQGEVEWVDGAADKALVMTEDDLITIPPLNVTVDTLTMTGWIKPARVHRRTGIIFMRNGTLTTGINLMPNNQLGYHWLDVTESWQYESGLIAPIDEWAFVAMVVTPDVATFYLDSVDTVRELVRVHEPVAFSGELTLGSDTLEVSRRYVGALDDLRFYNRALTVDELANVIAAGTRPSRESDPMAVEDFNSYKAYGGDIGQWVWDVWSDGLGGNGTGSTVGNEFEPIMSRDAVVNGGQALPLGYNNTGSFVDMNGNPASVLVSEISRSFSPAQDLTREGATALTLWIRGNQTNTAESTDSLYLAVKDTAGQEAVAVMASAADLLKFYWQKKTIHLSALANVDLSRVSEIIIGIGNRTSPQTGGSGTFLIDDIVLSID